MVYYRSPIDIFGGRVPPAPRGIYAPECIAWYARLLFGFR